MIDTKKQEPWRPGPSTWAVHGGDPPNKPLSSVTVPIFQTATYTFENSAELARYNSGELKREKYGRYGNPTTAMVEGKIAGLELAEAALMFPTGMGAVSAAVLSYVSAGDHAIYTNQSYKQTRKLFTELLPRMGVEVSVIPMGDYDAMEQAVTPRTKVIFTESPTNPLLRVADLVRLAGIGHRHGVLTIVDSTFATPYNQHPLTFGVDIVVQSATKYLSGHNDLMAGFVVGPEALLEPVKNTRQVLGATADPHNAYLVSRGLKTFALRMERHNCNAQTIASFLDNHPKVERVYYPGLKSHPDYAVAREQMRGFGGVVSFDLKGTAKDASAFTDALSIPVIASNFGSVDSLVEQTALMSYQGYSDEQLAGIGISHSLIRLSVGIEDPEDLLPDLEAALEVVQPG
jgi:cystathionine gamma-synthase